MGQDLIGHKIGQLEIVERLGEGTSTTTFAALDGGGKRVVVKRLLDDLARRGKETAERFLRTSELEGRIRIRKHLAKVTGARRAPEGIFLTREFVEGRPLTEYVKAKELGSLDKDRVAEGICDAVRALSSRGVVHGGIHPGNVIIQPDGRVRVTDFALTRAVLMSGVEAVYPMDALRYLAPEQWKGESCGVQSDIYSVGHILLLLDMGKPLFSAQDWEGLQNEVRTGCKVACSVVAAAIDPNPKKRYEDIGELRKRIRARQATQEEPDSASTGQPVPETPPADERPSPSDPCDEARPRPVLEKPGALAAIFDVSSGEDLMAKRPPKPWRLPPSHKVEQRPLQLTNSGPGTLRLCVKGFGEGLSVSPEELTIPAGRIASIIVRVAPDSAPFMNLVFQWSEIEGNKSLQIKVFRG